MFKRLFIYLLISGLILTVHSASAKMLESRKIAAKEKRTEKIKSRVQDMAKKLNLNEEQIKKITEILTKVKDETVKLLEEAGSKIDELKKQGEADIESVLTEEQRNKLRTGFLEDSEDDPMKIYKTSY